LQLLYLSSIYIYIYINGRTDVCLSVGIWRANGNPNPCTNLDEILYTHPNMSKEGFGAGLIPPPPPFGPGGPETLKAEEHIFKNCLQNKRWSAGCKLIWAEPGTSASSKIKN